MALGRKTGGRKKGSRNKHKLVAEIKADTVVKAVEAGETPLEYMLRVMRDDTQPPERRDGMARSAAPYVHAKVSDSKFGVGDGEGMTLEELIHASYKAGAEGKKGRATDDGPLPGPAP